MSRKKSQGSQRPHHPGSKKTERYIQPSILLALKIKPSYGYELIHKISQFGFVEGQAPPGMIYRHLRDLEENGLVESDWETDGTGPAKRVYQLTWEGHEVLAAWITYLEKQAENLRRFIERYKDTQASLNGPHV
jgi:poly-beta-hydroxybutyrate-responsive repressor